MALTATDIGLPSTCSVPAQRGRLTKEAIRNALHPTGKAAKQLAEAIASVQIIATVSPDSVAIPASVTTKQINVLEVGIKEDAAPEEFLRSFSAHLGEQSKHVSKILYVLHRDDGWMLAAYRNANVHAGIATGVMLFGPLSWDTPYLHLRGEHLDDVWDSLCAQTALDDDDPHHIDERIAKQMHIRMLEGSLRKLQKAHSRTTQIATRNRLWEQMAAIRKELSALQGVQQ